MVHQLRQREVFEILIQLRVGKLTPIGIENLQRGAVDVDDQPTVIDQNHALGQFFEHPVAQHRDRFQNAVAENAAIQHQSRRGKTEAAQIEPGQGVER